MRDMAYADLFVSRVCVLSSLSTSLLPSRTELWFIKHRMNQTFFFFFSMMEARQINQGLHVFRLEHELPFSLEGLE